MTAGDVLKNAQYDLGDMTKGINVVPPTNQVIPRWHRLLYSFTSPDQDICIARK